MFMRIVRALALVFERRFYEMRNRSSKVSCARLGGRSAFVLAGLALTLFAGPRGVSAQVPVVVDAVGDVGSYASLALDAQNRPHISYYDATNGDLKYATMGTGGWNVTVVDSVGDVGRHSSIALDASGNPHISYYDVTNGNLKYARWTGSAWVIEVPDQTGDVGLYTSIAVARQLPLPFIAYTTTNERLKLAYKDNATATTWIVKDCCDARLLNGSISIALDAQNVNPLIAYFDANDQNLKLAMFDRSASLPSPPYVNGWGIERVTAATIMEDVALVLDRANEPHLAYIEIAAGVAHLKYATKTCIASGCLTQIDATQPTGQGLWTINEPPGTTNVIDFASLALNSNDDPLIAFYDSGLRMRYAFRSANVWTVQTVDAEGDVGSHNSVVVGSDGAARFAYYDRTNGDLKFAGPASPDLIVESLTHSPLNPTTASVITFTAAVRNIGSAPAGPSTVKLRVGGETFGQDFAVPDLDIGASYTVTRSILLGVAQNYRATAVADAGAAVNEVNEGNNTRTDDFRVTTALGPDLVVRGLTVSPANPTTGDVITFRVTVANVGDAPAGASTLNLRVGGETFGQDFAVGPLGPNAIFTIDRRIVLARAQNYGATATADARGTVTESNEGNNRRTLSFTVRP
jgi:hypothetical protein